MKAQQWPSRQLHRKLKFSTNRFDIAPERRQTHIRLALDLRDRRLFDVERGRDLSLSLSRNLAQFPEAFDFLLQFIAPLFARTRSIARELYWINRKNAVT